MKPLNQITREELWSTDWLTLIDLCKEHGVESTGFDRHGPYTLSSLTLLPKLEKVRLELQQDAAEARSEDR